MNKEQIQDKILQTLDAQQEIPNTQDLKLLGAQSAQDLVAVLHGLQSRQVRAKPPPCLETQQK
jgi:hypothetical protein